MRAVAGVTITPSSDGPVVIEAVLKPPRRIHRYDPTYNVFKPSGTLAERRVSSIFGFASGTGGPTENKSVFAALDVVPRAPKLASAIGPRVV